MHPPLIEAQLEKLRSLSTPVVCNAIETFHLRLRNEGFIRQGVESRLTWPQPMVGYAVTVRMRTDAPPMRGSTYTDRSDWWNICLATPNPKIIVIEDADQAPGAGSVCGGLHGAIFKALGCVGIITNGAVRDLQELEKQRLHVYSGSIIPSHAYAHIVEVGTPVEIGGLPIACGDLLHGDRNGVVNIPQDIAADIHARAQAQLEHEHKIVEYCRTPGFSVETLRQMVAEMTLKPEEGR